MSTATRRLRRVGVGGLAAVLAFGIAPASAAADVQFNHVYDEKSGYETSAEVASFYGASDTAILASGETEHYADALSANYLAGQSGASIPLSRFGPTAGEILARLCSRPTHRDLSPWDRWLGQRHCPKLAIDFSDGGYTLGDQSPAGQNGWYGWGHTIYDWALVDADSDFPDSDLKGPVLRFSNAIDDTNQYGNITQLSSPVIEAAGEESTGAMYDTFEARFTVASATGGLQPGLLTEVDIDGRVGTTSGGTRAGGVIGLRHLEGSDGGLQIFLRWPVPGSEADESDWRNASVVVRADKPHKITVRAHFVEDGADVVKVFVDGRLKLVGSTLEGYHDAVAAFESQDSFATDKQTVNSLLFRATTTGPTEDGIGWDSSLVPTGDQIAALDGKGFLYSDISYRVFNTIP